MEIWIGISDNMKERIFKYLCSINFDARKMYNVDITDKKYQGKIIGRGFYSDELQDIIDSLNSSVFIDRMNGISMLEQNEEGSGLDINTTILKIRFLGDVQFRLHIGDGKTYFNNQELVSKEDKFFGFICKLKQEGKPNLINH